jgi:hypothetical protein
MKQIGYIALYKDIRLEIPLEDAKDIYAAKLIAIKYCNIPKSKQDLLSIEPRYE